MDKRPFDWDWVTERGNCSIPVMFERLRDLAKRDVQKRNEQVLRQQFQVLDEEDVDVRERSFRVVDSSSSRDVEFQRDDKLIVVRLRRAGAVETQLRVTLTLTDEAGCQFKLDSGEQVLDGWQLMKRALEPLFFA